MKENYNEYEKIVGRLVVLIQEQLKPLVEYYTIEEDEIHHALKFVIRIDNPIDKKYATHEIFDYVIPFRNLEHYVDIIRQESDLTSLADDIANRYKHFIVNQLQLDCTKFY